LLCIAQLNVFALSLVAFGSAMIMMLPVSLLQRHSHPCSIQPAKFSHQNRVGKLTPQCSIREMFSTEGKAGLEHLLGASLQQSDRETPK